MKKIITIMAFSAISMLCFAQNNVQQAAADAAEAIANAPQAEPAKPKPVYWTESADLNIGFNQTGLTNWAAGGYNTMNLSAGLDAKANYKKALMSWNNRLQLNYAFLHSSDKLGLFQKSNDRIYLESKWAYQTAKDSKWNYSAAFDFRSQFTDTPAKYIQYDSNNDSSIGEGDKWKGEGLKSGFISPAYTNLALGLEWKPNNWLDINMAPLTGGFTIVDNPLLRKIYGMELRCAEDDPGYVAANATNDAAKYGPYFRSAKFQFGAQVKADMKFTINENLKYETQVVLFTDYLDHPFTWVRVNWDNKISWKIAKYFNIAFNTWLIYDPIVKIVDDKDKDIYPDGIQRIQFKEFLSFNFSYTFQPRKK